MNFPDLYSCLKKNKYKLDSCSLIPVRYNDRNDILAWRNNQISILRQKKVITSLQQDTYFNEVVSNLFSESHPDQLLFSYLEEDMLIGYGGLVHINWRDRNAEISFLLDPQKNNQKYYLKLFDLFLKMIMEIAIELRFHKIFTYGYDIDSYRFEPLTANSFQNEAILKNHVVAEGKLCNVKIYSVILK